MSCTYRLHFDGYMKSHAIHTIILKALYCAARAATFWQVLPTLSCMWSSFYLLFEALAQNPGAEKPTHPADEFGFRSHPLFQLPFLTIDAMTRRCFLTIRSPYLNLQMIWVEQQFAICCLKTSCYQFPFLLKCSKAVTQKLHEIRYMRFCMYIK